MPRREFKREAAKLIWERRVWVSQAVRNLDLHEHMPRKWVRGQVADPGSAFSGYGVMRLEQNIEQLRRELRKMKWNATSKKAAV